MALSALMRVSPERRLELGQEAWRRLVQCPENAYRRYLLCECVDAYLPLDEEQRRAYETSILSDPDPGVRTMSMTLFEKFREQGRQEGLQQGVQQGRQEALRVSLELLLGRLFGPLSAEVKGQLASLSAEKLDDLLHASVQAQSLEELGLKS